MRRPTYCLRTPYTVGTDGKEKRRHGRDSTVDLCCWCGRRFLREHLPTVLVDQEWHNCCPMCLRHYLPADAVKPVRAFFGPVLTNEQETMPL